MPFGRRTCCEVHDTLYYMRSLSLSLSLSDSKEKKISRRGPTHAITWNCESQVSRQFYAPIRGEYEQGAAILLFTTLLWRMFCSDDEPFDRKPERDRHVCVAGGADVCGSAWRNSHDSHVTPLIAHQPVFIVTQRHFVLEYTSIRNIYENIRTNWKTRRAPVVEQSKRQKIKCH